MEEKFAGGKFRGRKISRKIKIRENSEIKLHAKNWCYTVYRSVERPAFVYGTETRATTKNQERRLELNEMRMLRWMCGVKKIKNDTVTSAQKQT